MKNNHILIFDLDDTIFETKSISQKHVAPILEKFKISITSVFNTEEVNLIMSDLWKYPFDYVSEKYNLNDSVKQQFTNSINCLDYKLEISTFSDFEIVRNIQNSKMLVTTGFKKLQLAKISALNIEDEFEEIHIDEIDSTNRIHKKGIFQNLINTKNRKPADFIVIGDNPQSEIKAGHEIGSITVQVAKFSQPKSSYADYYIQDFQDLIQILEERT